MFLESSTLSLSVILMSLETARGRSGNSADVPFYYNRSTNELDS